MKNLFICLASFLLFSCGGNEKKEKVIEILKAKIGQNLPFENVKIADIENGTGVIVDGNWCYWIDKNDNIYCVNGASKTIYNDVNDTECKDAPIKSGFMEIEKIAE